MDRSLIDRSRRAETGHSPALHGLSALSPPTELTIRRVLCKGSVLPCRRASRGGTLPCWQAPARTPTSSIMPCRRASRRPCTAGSALQACRQQAAAVGI